jgi:Zn-dependent protease/predicted transcriptional regulator
MKWSWKIARVAGIDVKIHATFLLILIWIGASYYITGGTFNAAVNGVLYLLTLFLCVILHEFGHALTARRYGIQTADITLLPIGGVARLERMPEEPKQELWVALAGPAVNVVIAAVLAVILFLTGGFNAATAFSMTEGPFLERIMLVNVFLAVFNLIPAFPMDGGRVVRALLATRLEYTQATQVAATLGQVIAFVFGLIGLFTNPFLVFIALFVYMGAAQEASMVQVKSALNGIPVSNAMLTEFHTLKEGDSLSHAVELMMSGSQHEFPVMSGERVVGVLTRKGLVDGLQRLGQAAPVSGAMDCDFDSVDTNAMLEEVSRKLQTRSCHTIPVVHSGQLVGLVTMENIGEFLMIRSALKKSGRGNFLRMAQ